MHERTATTAVNAATADFDLDAMCLPEDCLIRPAAPNVPGASPVGNPRPHSMPGVCHPVLMRGSTSPALGHVGCARSAPPKEEVGSGLLEGKIGIIAGACGGL